MSSCTAFAAGRRIAKGPLLVVAPHVKAAYDAGAPQLLVFDDSTGRLVELDLRGSPDEVLGRLTPAPTAAPRGRPKLGVTAREVTLLPSHWEWLAAQPGGASAALRRLVEEAKRSSQAARRQARDVAYRVMSALGGDLPDFEEASRAFFAGDFQRLEDLLASWPADVRDYVSGLVARIRAID